jgi:hypothetical protein
MNLRPMKKNNKLIIIVLIAISGSLFFTFLPFKPHYTKSRLGKIYPARQWFLIRSRDGVLITATKDNMSGVHHEYKVNLFDRGELVQVKLCDGLLSGRFIQAGDTIGTIYSSSIFENYIGTQGRLKVAKAQLEVSLTGDKESVIVQHIRQFELAKVEAAKQAQVVKRLQELHKKGLISDEEYQLASEELDILHLVVQTKQAELEAVRSGEKPAEINRLKDYISSIEDDLGSIKKQMSDLVITAPFSGTIDRAFNSDTLLILSESQRFLISIPIPVEDEPFIGEDSKLVVTLGNKDFIATIIEVSNEIHIIGGKANLLVHALINKTDQKLHHGMVGKVKIKGKNMHILPYLANILDN